TTLRISPLCFPQNSAQNGLYGDWLRCLRHPFPKIVNPQNPQFWPD
ncbi:Uncharacterized protein APZ42_007031, partial [Daphnia magna]